RFPQTRTIVGLGWRAVSGPHRRQETARVGKKEDAQASLRAWLRANIGRKRGQKSGKGLAKALKLHQSQVTQMMKPGGRKVQAHEMPVITAYIGHEPPPEVVSGAFEAGIEAQNGARAVMTPARVRVRIVGTN